MRTCFGVRRQSEAATALWSAPFYITKNPKRCRAALATALQKASLFDMAEKPKQAAKETKQVARVRRFCLALPETMEKLSHGEPTFFVHKRVFAMCSINHHNDGHIAVTVPAAIGIQQMLIEAEPKKYYRPPYVGGAGWVGIELPRVTDKELRMHLREAWKLIAPEKMHGLLK